LEMEGQPTRVKEEDDRPAMRASWTSLYISRRLERWIWRMGGGVWKRKRKKEDEARKGTTGTLESRPRPTATKREGKDESRRPSGVKNGARLLGLAGKRALPSKYRYCKGTVRIRHGTPGPDADPHCMDGPPDMTCPRAKAKG
jgi:hypothetical protein